jgi:hypothetical protein
MDMAFAEHIRKEHLPEQTSSNASQAECADR